MTPHDFVTWLKGIRDSFAPEAPPPIVWDRIVAEIDKVGTAALVPPPIRQQPSIFDQINRDPKPDRPNRIEDSYPFPGPRTWLGAQNVAPLLSGQAVLAVDEQMDAVGPKN